MEVQVLSLRMEMRSERGGKVKGGRSRRRGKSKSAEPKRRRGRKACCRYYRWSRHVNPLYCVACGTFWNQDEEKKGKKASHRKSVKHGKKKRRKR